MNDQLASPEYQMTSPTFLSLESKKLQAEIESWLIQCERPLNTQT